MDVTLLMIPNHHFVMIPRAVCFDLYAKRSVDLKLKADSASCQ